MTNESLREEWRKHYLKTVAKKMPTIDDIADWWIAKLQEAVKEVVAKAKATVLENSTEAYTSTASSFLVAKTDKVMFALNALHPHSKDEK